MADGQNARCPRLLQRADLVAQRLHHIGWRPYKSDAGRVAGADELGVLGQIAVAGMDSIDAILLGNRQDRLRLHVALRPGQGDAFVGQPHVQGAAVAGLIDGHCVDAHLAAGADDTHSDLAAVGDEEFVEHGFLQDLRGLRQTSEV